MRREGEREERGGEREEEEREKGEEEEEGGITKGGKEVRKGGEGRIGESENRKRKKLGQEYTALILQKLTSDFTACGLGVEEVEAVGNEG